MNVDHDVERQVADYYATEPPTRAPDWLLVQALDTIETTPQRRAVLGRPWKFPPMISVGKLGVVAIAVVMVAAVGLTLQRQPAVGPAPSVGPASELGIFTQVSGRILSGVWGEDLEAVDPTDPARSTTLRMGPESVLALDWSGDGTKLLFSRKDRATTDPFDANLFILHADGTETQVTPMPVGGAAISPDGSRVVFAGATDGDDGLYIVDAEGGQPVRIADGEEPTFSPDGTQIAYLGLPRDGCCVEVGREHVWVMNSDGTDAHEILADEPALARGAEDLTWSPAGDRIAIVSRDGEQNAIYTFAPDGSAFTKVITDGINPFWSPDGSQIAYLVPYGEPQLGRTSGLAIVDADGSNPREFGFGASGPWHPGTPVDERAPVDSPTPVETPSPDVPPSPDASNGSAVSDITRVDGEVLRFAEQSGGVGDLIAVHPESGETRVLVEGLDDVDGAAWSADGRWLAYQIARGALWVIGVDQPPRQLGRTSEWAWSSKGSQLAQVDDGSLSVFEASTGQLTELGSTGAPVWSPDGTKLVDGERGGSIFLVDARTGERSLVARLPGADLDSVDEIEWSPDGTRLAIFNDIIPGFGRLYVLNADGSGLRVIVEDAPVSELDWSPDGTRIAFTESNDVELSVWVAPADGSTPSLLVRHPNQGSGGDPVWSPDGSQIAFWTEHGEALVIAADGSGGVAPLDALTYETWRGGWYACSTCVIGVQRF